MTNARTLTKTNPKTPVNTVGKGLLWLGSKFGVRSKKIGAIGIVIGGDSAEFEATNRMDKELELYDFTAWVGKWPHEKQSIWETHSKVYARFGIAVQACTKLETGLVMLVAQRKQLKNELIMLAAEMEQVENELVMPAVIMEHFKKRKFTLEFKSLLTELSKAGALTLGRLIGLFQKLFQIPKDDPVIQELQRAKESRNYLIHHFYRHRADHFESPEGCERLVKELVSISDDFFAALEILEDWQNRNLGYQPLDDILDEINEDVAKWRCEQEQMLNAILGNKGRKP